MPRRPRALREAGIFHVTSRGNNRRNVFVDVADRQVYLAKLDHAASTSEWSLLSWCQLDNHVHLLVRSEPEPLSDGMQRLNGGYSKHFNRRHRRGGHLWENRFKLREVKDDAHLLMALAYIARNPVEAGCSATPDGWLWSSHRALAGGRARDVAAVDEALGLLDEDPRKARRRYVDVAGTASRDRPHEPSLWRPSVDELLLACEQREVAVAVAVIDYGYTPAEIAERCDASEPTVWRWLRAGRAARDRVPVPRSR